MPRKKAGKKKDENIEELCSDEDEVCFCDTPKIEGKAVASFSFNNTNTAKEEVTPIVAVKEKHSSSGERTYKRSYKLTPSAIRKIDTLKAKHPDLTTYVSNIVEAAINYYYDYIMKGGSLK